MKAWYGCDFTLFRFVKSDKVDQTHLYIELYPEKVIEEDLSAINRYSPPPSTRRDNLLASFE